VISTHTNTRQKSRMSSLYCMSTSRPPAAPFPFHHVQTRSRSCSCSRFDRTKPLEMHGNTLGGYILNGTYMALLTIDVQKCRLPGARNLFTVTKSVKTLVEGATFVCGYSIYDGVMTIQMYECFTFVAFIGGF
jgi:hypothetical protein